MICGTGVGYINDSTTVVEGSILLVQWLVQHDLDYVWNRQRGVTLGSRTDYQAVTKKGLAAKENYSIPKKKKKKKKK